jgi:glycosyltransferase involved in cell wall biosynthesis
MSIQEKPLITIAIPAYKSAFLRQAIQSALEQSYEHIELIILNDGSPENLDEIIDSFNDKRINYYKNKTNIGNNFPTRNWNKCLELSSGDFFALLSDDDVYCSNFINELWEISINYPHTNLFHARVKEIDISNQLISYSPACPEFETGLDFMWHRFKMHRMQFVSDFMCRTKQLKTIGGFYELPLSWGSDDITWFQIALQGGVAYSSKALCCWRNSPCNLSSSGSLELRLKALNQYKTWIKQFIDRFEPEDLVEHEFLTLIKQVYRDFIKAQQLLLLTSFADNTNLTSCFLKMIQMKRHYSVPEGIMVKAALRSIKKRFKHHRIG